MCNVQLLSRIYALLSVKFSGLKMCECKKMTYIRYVWMLLEYHTFLLIGGDLESALEQNPVFHTLQVSHQLK